MISLTAIFVISFTSFGITEGMPAFRARKKICLLCKHPSNGLKGDYPSYTFTDTVNSGTT